METLEGKIKKLTDELATERGAVKAAVVCDLVLLFLCTISVFLFGRLRARQGLNYKIT